MNRRTGDLIVGHISCLTLPDGPALSLDINQPAANPAALAMAILNSAKSRGRASNDPQVPLVIISQPLPGPVAGQSGPPPQVRAERSDESAANAAAAPPAAESHADLQPEVVVEMIQISIDPNESPGDGARSSACVTSHPVANDRPTSEPTASRDPPTPEREPAAVVVSVFLNI